MGGRGRLVALVGAGLAALVLAGSLAWAATTGGLTPRARFGRWLQSQPGLAGAELLPTARADGDVPRPTAQAATTDPLTTERVELFMRAMQTYAAGHAEAVLYTVQLHHGPDHVIASGSREDNAEMVAEVRALRALPDLYAVDIGIAPYPPHVTAVLTTGSDLAQAATTLARSAVVADERSAPWRGVGITVRGEGLPHTVTVHGDVGPSKGAARAFTLATRLEGRRPVQLQVQHTGAGGTWTELRLDEQSPTAASTRSAVNALGFGMAQHEERVTGGAGGRQPAPFDTAAWRRAALPAVLALPGVRSATLGDPDDTGPVVLDVRMTGAGLLDRLASVVPDAVDVVAAHTAAHAPDYDRKAALPPDPETSCPASTDGVVNTAYTGSPEALPAAAAYLTALRRAPAVSCLHWWVPGPGHTVTGEQVDVRVPLQGRSWGPVLDTVLTQLRNPGAVHPDVALILVPRALPWTALLLLHPGQAEPYPTTLVAGSAREVHEATEAQEPLLDYWRAASSKS